MARYFVTRHQGAVQWAADQGYQFDHYLSHLDESHPLKQGDVVAGILPVHWVAQLCAQGVIYLNLSLDLPPAWRGQELSAAQLTACAARLERFVVHAVADDLSCLDASL
jgi:CRISPR-associated protein Csx16